MANAAAPAQMPMIMATASPAGTMTVGGTGGEAVLPAEPATNPIQTVNGKTFLLQNGVWTDTAFQPDTMQTQKVVFLSDEYFALIEKTPALAPYFAIGDKVIAVVDGVAYEVTAQ